MYSLFSVLCIRTELYFGACGNSILYPILRMHIEIPTCCEESWVALKYIWHRIFGRKCVIFLFFPLKLSAIVWLEYQSNETDRILYIEEHICSVCSRCLLWTRYNLDSRSSIRCRILWTKCYWNSNLLPGMLEDNKRCFVIRYFRGDV